MEKRTTSTSFFRTEVELGARGQTAFQAALHRVLLVDPFRRLQSNTLFGIVDRRAQLAEIVQVPDAPHSVLGAPCVLRTSLAGIVL